jgi:hypothetical protein
MSQEVKRYASEIDRLRRLVARRGTGAGQDGVSLVTYDDKDEEDNRSRAHGSGRGGASSASAQFNTSQSSLYSRRSRSPPSGGGTRPDFNKTIRTPGDFSKNMKPQHGHGEMAGFRGGDRGDLDRSHMTRSVQFSTEKQSTARSPVFSPSKKGAISRQDEHNSPQTKAAASSRLKWGALHDSLAQQVSCISHIAAA